MEKCPLNNNDNNKYKDLKIEIEKMWHLKTTMVLVIVGALGMFKKGTDNITRYLAVLTYIKKIKWNKKINKITLCTTAHLLGRENRTEKYHPKESTKTNA